MKRRCSVVERRSSSADICVTTPANIVITRRPFTDVAYRANLRDAR
jgi:hypothetical protein